jgi:hypothetical protein
VTTSKVGVFVFSMFGPLGEAAGGEDDKVVFDEKQQAKVNEIVQQRLAQERKQLMDKYDKLKTDFDSVKSELDEAKTRSAKAKTSKEKEGADDDVEALKSQLDELKGLVTSAKSEAEQARKEAKARERELESARNTEKQYRKEVAISKAAGKIAFFDINAVRKLTEDNIEWSDEHGKFIVLREDKQPRLNSSLELMSLEEYFTEWSVKNPWAVRSDVKPGAGSTQQQQRSGVARYELTEIFGPKSDARKAMELKKSAPDAYKRMKSDAIEAGLIAG